jgi:flagellar hook-associated protein 1
MSLSSLLSIARSALLLQQRAMNVTAHNVANAQTPGYSRQRLQIVAATPGGSPNGSLGRGVDDLGVTRQRDLLLDATFRREAGGLGSSVTLSGYLAQVESSFGEPSDSGVAAALGGLFLSFDDLAKDPSSSSARTLVKQAASLFVDRLHRLDAQLAQAGEDARQQLQSDVAEANALAGRIAGLNVSILAARGGSDGVPDLEDQRDLLLDQLSTLLSVRVISHEDGTVGVIAGDTLLVDGGQSQTISVVAAAGGGFGIENSGGSPVEPKSGRLQALVEFSQETLPGIRTQLDTFVRTVVTEVNAIHRTGVTASGDTFTDFFDPAGLTAATIALAPGIASAPSLITAGGTSEMDGSVALRLAGLARSGLAALGGQTLNGYYIDLAVSTGARTREAMDAADVQQSVVDNAEAQRMSVSSVSVDEEMVSLLAQQQAYGAAARLVQTAQAMMDEVLKMI